MTKYAIFKNGMQISASRDFESVALIEFEYYNLKKKHGYMVRAFK